MTVLTADHPFPGNVLQTAGTFDQQYGAEEVRWFTSDIDSASVVTSIVAEDDGLPEARPEAGYPTHRPVLDIDFPAKLIPSSTEGHFHLYLDKPMPWETYLTLLRALRDAGILEDGYVKAAEDRGFSGVRLPWVKK